MTWVKLDDGFADHPKTIAAGPHGVALFVASLCWVSRNLTDGRVPKHILPMLTATAAVKPAVAQKLVEVGYWRDRGDHWEINGYLERNPTKEHVEKERARWRRYKQSSTAESTAESTRESTRESTADSTAESRKSPPRTPRSPDPDPKRTDLQLPPTSTVTRLNGRAGEVLETLMTAERQASGPVRNRRAWETTVRTRLETEHGTRIASLIARYPGAPPDVIAGAIEGNGQNLRYYQTNGDPT
jgi:hypothetical protein